MVLRHINIKSAYFLGALATYVGGLDGAMFGRDTSLPDLFFNMFCCFLASSFCFS